MANDRLYIQHASGEGGQFYLAKSMGEGWYVVGDPATLAARLDAWFQGLVTECSELGHGYDTKLELITEDDPRHDYGKEARFDDAGNLIQPG